MTTTKADLDLLGKIYVEGREKDNQLIREGNERARNIVHYRETGKERAARLKSTGDYSDGCLCGNGDFYATTTRDRDKVTCLPCIHALVWSAQSN